MVISTEGLVTVLRQTPGKTELEPRDAFIASKLLSIPPQGTWSPIRISCILLYSADRYGFFFELDGNRIDHRGEFSFHRLWQIPAHRGFFGYDYLSYDRQRTSFPQNLLDRISDAPREYVASRKVPAGRRTGDLPIEVAHAAVKSRDLLDEVKFYSSTTELVPKENKYGHGFSGYVFPDLDEMMEQECKDGEFNGLQEKYDRNKDSRAYLSKAYPRPDAARAMY